MSIIDIIYIYLYKKVKKIEKQNYEKLNNNFCCWKKTSNKGGI